MKQTLGIDYGTKRIGLAISRGTLAEPYQIIDATQEPIKAIHSICQAEGIEQLVVGMSENTMAERTRDFARELESEVKLPVTFVDETLSSYIVATKLKEMGASLNRRQQPIDDLAASLFLQEWLDEQ